MPLVSLLLALLCLMCVMSFPSMRFLQHAMLTYNMLVSADHFHLLFLAGWSEDGRHLITWLAVRLSVWEK